MQLLVEGGGDVTAEDDEGFSALLNAVKVKTTTLRKTFLYLTAHQVFYNSSPRWWTFAATALTAEDDGSFSALHCSIPPRGILKRHHYHHKRNASIFLQYLTSS